MIVKNRHRGSPHFQMAHWTGNLNYFLMASDGRAFPLSDGRLIVGGLGEQEVDLNGQSIDALILRE